MLFERLVLEINQAGIFWITILKKAENLRQAYESFSIDKVAVYGETDTRRFLAEAGIVRNRLKINAAVENARRIQHLRREFDSFGGRLDAHHPQTLENWSKLFKQSFVFTGGEIVREFLVSTGYISGAYDQDCPIFEKVAVLRPAWAIIE